MKVMVIKKQKEENKDVIEQSKDIICPDCKEQKLLKKILLPI